MKKLLTIFLLCLTTSAFGQFQQKPMLGQQINWSHPLSRGLVGAWFMFEGTGSKVFDLSGNGNIGTFTGDTHWVPGKFGSALSFDGDGDNVDCGNNTSLDILQAISIVIYVKNAEDKEYANLVDKYESNKGYSLKGAKSSSSKPIKFSLGDGASVTTLEYSIGLPVGKWHQVAATYDGSDMTIYYDGAYGNSGAGPSGIAATTNRLAIGNISPDLSQNIFYGFNGIIDHVMIYNRALSASEIALLYREPFCMFQQDNIALIALEEEAPPTGGQVIMIQMSMLSPIIFFALFCVIKGRKCRQR